MTIRSLVNRYFGWCPRFDLPPLKFAPFSELKISAMMAVFLIVIGWGLSSLITGIRLFIVNIPGLINSLYSPPIARAFFRDILYLPTGAAILLLVADYAATGKILKRHRVEFVVAVCLSSLLRISNFLYDFGSWMSLGLTFNRLALWASWPPSVYASAMSAAPTVILLTLTFYTGYIVVKGKTLITRWMLALVAAYFVWFAVDYIYIIASNGGQFLQLWPIDELAFTLTYFTYAATGVYLLYLAARFTRGKVLRVTMPISFRLVLLAFGVVGIVYNVWWNLDYRGSMTWDDPWVMFVGIVVRAAMVFLALRPPSFTLGARAELGT